MSPTFRPLTPEDSEELIDLRLDLWPDCPLAEQREEIAAALVGDGIIIVADVDGVLAGFAEVSIRWDYVEGTQGSPTPYLEGWYVRPDYRGQHIGTGLLRYVESWAAARGYRELASDTELENTASIALHGKLGFREAGRIVCFVKPLPPPEPENPET